MGTIYKKISKRYFWRCCRTRSLNTIKICGHSRITSYNVCYTKLLRMRRFPVLAAQRVVAWQSLRQPVAQAIAAAEFYRAHQFDTSRPRGFADVPGTGDHGDDTHGEPGSVITSYSIHYTKLYETGRAARSLSWQNGNHRSTRTTVSVSSRPRRDAIHRHVSIRRSTTTTC